MVFIRRVTFPRHFFFFGLMLQCYSKFTCEISHYLIAKSMLSIRDCKIAMMKSQPLAETEECGVDGGAVGPAAASPDKLDTSHDRHSATSRASMERG